MRKLLSHYYKVTIREDGKWCFKREGWKKKSYEHLLDDYLSILIIIAVSLVVGVVI